MWFLVMDVCSIKTFGIWRHNIYSITKTRINFPTLVSSHNSSSLFMVLIFRTYCICEVVYGVKLFCAFHNVWLLCSESNEIQNTKIYFNINYYSTNNTNDYSFHYKYCRLSIFEKPERM